MAAKQKKVTIPVSIPVVQGEPEQTFEERTSGVNQPWLNEDGSQNTGE